MADQDLTGLRQAILSAGRLMVGKGLVIATWGNISCRANHGNSCLVTPSGMAYEELQAADLVLVDDDGSCGTDQRKPTSELLLHRRIYAARPDVQAIVHTHSQAACSFAVARREIPVILEEMAQLIGGQVAAAPYAPPGSEALAENALLAMGGRNAVLLANHGVVAVGRSLAEALIIAQLVEKAAQVMLGAVVLGQPRIISPEETAALRQNFLDSYGQGSIDKS